MTSPPEADRAGEGDRAGDRLSFEQRLMLLAVAVAAPGTLLALALLAASDFSAPLRIFLSLGLVATTGWLVARLRGFVVSPLQVLANLLQALREEDYSLRARRARAGDALGEAFLEANLLGETLQGQRLEAVEATTLLQRVLEEMDVALFVFDGEDVLQLLNPAGASLLDRPILEALGRSARDIGLGPLLEASRSGAGTLEHELPGGSGRWGIRQRTFRAEGRPHLLLLVADLSRPLRDEELQAWKRLIRVLGHELNNSLTPIKSMASTLERLLRRTPRSDDWEDEAATALRIIADRAESLSRFVGAYGQLARLPPPREAPCDLAELLRRVAALETRVSVVVEPGDPVELLADPDQLEQLLINLVRNAAEAMGPDRGTVTMRWIRRDRRLEIQVDDEGPGITNPGNLFVPFFSTKPSGSGIGLVLCRQIAEAHGGTLTLANRRGGGCRASLRLPLRSVP